MTIENVDILFGSDLSKKVGLITLDSETEDLLRQGYYLRLGLGIKDGKVVYATLTHVPATPK